VGYPIFIDEIVNLEAGANFLSSFSYSNTFGNYTQSFDPFITTGPLATLIGGLPLVLGFPVLYSRVLFLLVSLSLLIFLLIKIARFHNFKFYQVLTLSGILLGCWSEVALYFSIMWGEVFGSLILVAGVLHYQQGKLRSAFLLFSSAAILVKTIFVLPVLGYFLLLLLKNIPLKNKINIILLSMTPLGFVLVNIFFDRGLAGVLQYPFDVIAAFSQNGSGLNSEMNQVSISLVLENVKIVYSNTGIGIFLLSCITLIFGIRNWREKSFDDLTPLFLSFLFYFLWFFMKGRAELTRHLAPMIFCCWYISLIPMLKILNKKENYLRPLLIGLFFILYVPNIQRDRGIILDDLKETKFIDHSIVDENSKSILKEMFDD